MQRARQRANSVLTLEKAMSDWTRVRRCAEGTRIPMNGQLGAIPQPEVRDTIVKVDQVIDHARRFVHDGGRVARMFFSRISRPHLCIFYLPIIAGFDCLRLNQWGYFLFQLF